MGNGSLRVGGIDGRCLPGEARLEAYRHGAGGGDAERFFMIAKKVAWEELEPLAWTPNV